MKIQFKFNDIRNNKITYIRKSVYTMKYSFNQQNA